ncbi:ankyrin [Hypoxylon sp. FL1857]|nr:ankyrin [Hypoxylon sp. FL1857]
MDPLSIAASIITLVQATAGIAKGVRFLRSIGQIPLEFAELVNELSTLQAVAEQVRAGLKDYEDQSLDKGSDDGLTGLDPSILISLKTDLFHIVDELDALCGRLTKPTRQSQIPGQPCKEHVSTLRWQKEKNRIAKLKQKAQSTRGYLSLCFSVINSSQLRRQARITVDIKEVVCTSAQDISLLRGNESIHQENRTLLEAIHGSINQLNDSLLNGDQVLTLNQPVNDLGVGNVHSETMANQPNTAPMVYFQASLIQECPSFCACNCHRPSQSRSPDWLRSRIGSLFLQYNAVPLLRRPRCDVTTCRLKSNSSFRLNYAFPRWLLARQVEFAISWSSITGAGSSLHLAIPRVTNLGEAFFAIRRSDIRWLRVNVAKKLIFPTDVNEDGESLLCCALQSCRFEIAQFLVEQGSNINSRDRLGRTAAIVAQSLFYEFHDSSKPWRSFLYNLSMCHERDKAAFSSKIHRAILFGNEPLSTVITQNLDYIDSFDRCGCSPLHWAVIRGDVAAVEALLRAGAKPNNPSVLRGTPLLQAVSRRHNSIARLLLDAGADPNPAHPYATSKPIYFTFGNPEMLRLLLDHGAHVTCNFGSGPWTPLDYAAAAQYTPYRSSDRPFLKESLDCLINAGIDINNRSGAWLTPVTSALQNGNDILLDLLIEAGARLDIVDADGWGVMHVAANSARLECIEVLRRAKISRIDPNMPDMFGETPLDILAWRTSKPDDELRPGEKRITDEEFWAFKQLVEEIQQRNNEIGYSHLVEIDPDNRLREIEAESLDASEDDGSSVDIDGESAELGGSPRRGSICTESDSSSSDEFFDCVDE